MSPALKTGLAVAACAAAGPLASRQVGSSCYRRLAKPVVQPPPIAFPIAWTTSSISAAVWRRNRALA